MNQVEHTGTLGHACIAVQSNDGKDSFNLKSELVIFVFIVLQFEHRDLRYHRGSTEGV